MTPTSPSATTYEQLRAVSGLITELQRLRVAALSVERPPPHPDPLVGAVHAAHHLLHVHPIAAQAAFQALVAEGRRAAATPAGHALLEAMAGDPRLDAARRLWEASPLRLLQEDTQAPLPSAMIDAWMQAATAEGLDQRLLGLLRGAL